MIKGLMPNINVYIMKDKHEEDEGHKSMLAEMLRRKEKSDNEMLAKLDEMAGLMRVARHGTSHVGGG